MMTVIIPSFNRRTLLIEAVNSVLNQDVDDIEIIVIDDGSTDGTGEALRAFGQRIRYYRQHNRGPSAARNRGIALARGEYISFLDSDDLWLPGKVRHEIQLFQTHPGVEVLTGNGEYYLQGECQTPSIFSLKKRRIPFGDHKTCRFSWALSPILAERPLCITSALTLRRSALAKLGFAPFDESLRYNEDWDFEFRMFSRCRVMFYADPLCTVRVEDDGTRLHYSFPFPDNEISPDEKIREWSNRLLIMERYLGKIDWGQEAETLFRKQRAKIRHQLRLGKRGVLNNEVAETI